MTGGGGDAPLPPADNGGEFLLSLLQRPPLQPQNQLQPPLTAAAPPPPPPQQQQSPTLDPAVAVIGPTIPNMPPWQSNGNDPQPHHLTPWPPHALSPHYPPNMFGLAQNPFPHPRVPANHFHGNPIPGGNIGVALGDDLRRLGFPVDPTGGNMIDAFVQQQKLQEHKLKFGSFPTHEISSDGGSLLNLMFNVASGREAGVNRSYNGFDRNLQLDPKPTSNSNASVNVVGHPNPEGRRGSGRGHNYSNSGNYRPETRQPPPGFSNKPKGRGGHWGSGTRRRGSEFHEDGEGVNYGDLSGRKENVHTEKERVGKQASERSNRRGNKSSGVGLPEQLDRPGPPTGNYLHSVSGSAMEELRSNFQSKTVLDGVGGKYQGVVRSKEEDATDSGTGGGGQFVESMLPEDESEDKNNSRQRRSSRDKVRHNVDPALLHFGYFFAVCIIAMDCIPLQRTQL